MSGGKVGRCGLAPSTANDVKLTSGQRLILSALREMLPTGRGRLAQAEIVTYTGRSRGMVINALKAFEDAGLIERNRSMVPGVPTLIVVGNVSVISESQEVSDSGPLIDCFRTPDFIAPGNLWQVAPKGEPLTLGEVKKLSTSSVDLTVRNHLLALAGLPGKVVTIAPNPNRARAKLYTFHELDAEQQAVIAAHLNERLSRWRVKPRAEREAEHEESKQRGRELFGEAAYGHLAPRIIDLSVEGGPGLWQRKKHVPCWMFGGELSADGYGVVDGVRSPAIRAHRITYYAARGPIPPGRELHHLCNTPACVNPAHLFPLWPDEHKRETAMSQYARQLKKNRAKFRDDRAGLETADAKANATFTRATTLATPIGTPRPTAA